MPWIPSIGIGYHVGLDGVALLLVMLTTVLTPIVILSAWRAVEERVKEFMIALLVLETAMIGTFAALDLVLFYVFWELILVPMYLLIGVWGSQNRLYATVKFFIYTFAASVLMLLAILYVYFHDGGTFDYVEARRGAAGDARRRRRWLFLAFALAFAVKVPMFPLHTWLPDAHTEAPTAGSVILAGVLLKMGTFGFFRYALPLFPEAALQFRTAIATLARDRDPLRRAHVARADRHEAARRLLLGLAPRLRDARAPGALGRGAHRRRLPDAEPRRVDGRAVPPRRHALRAAPHAPHRRVRRASRSRCRSSRPRSSS